MRKGNYLPANRKLMDTIMEEVFLCILKYKIFENFQGIGAFSNFLRFGEGLQRKTVDIDIHLKRGEISDTVLKYFEDYLNYETVLSGDKYCVKVQRKRPNNVLKRLDIFYGTIGTKTDFGVLKEETDTEVINWKGYQVNVQTLS